MASLSNLAGGVLLLFFKPFKLEDVIEVQGYVGVVEEIPFPQRNVHIHNVAS